MNFLKHSVTFFFSLVLLSASSFGQFDFNFNDRPNQVNRLNRPHANFQRFEVSAPKRNYSGYNTLYLKTLLQKRYPRVNFNNFTLVSVVLQSKSARGQADATLYQGNNYSDSKKIPGNSFEFRNQGYFNNVNLHANVSNAIQTWQVDLNGNIKINNIVISLKQKSIRPTPSPQLRFFLADSFQAEKIITLSKRLNIRGEAIKAIRLEATKAPVEIKSVKVTFGNGEQQYLKSLEGTLAKSNSKTARFTSSRRGVTIRSVEVTAVSILPWGSRSVVKVYTGK